MSGFQNCRWELVKEDVTEFFLSMFFCRTHSSMTARDMVLSVSGIAPSPKCDSEKVGRLVGENLPPHWQYIINIHLLEYPIPLSVLLLCHKKAGSAGLARPAVGSG